MIAERIVAGETADQIGIDTAEYASRRAVLDRYLARTGGAFDPMEYLQWLQQDKDGDRGPSEAPAPLPSTGTMVISAARDIGRFARSGFRILSARDVAARLAICRRCAQFTADRRCRVCGCYMKVKARMATTDCPHRKWPRRKGAK